MSYPNCMDHIGLLREKIGRLREEIAHLVAMNAEYRRSGKEGRNEIQAQVAHGQRQERLQAIQQELGQVAELGKKVLSIEERKEEHRSRLHSVKTAS